MKNFLVFSLMIVPFAGATQKDYSSLLDQYASAYAGAYNYHGAVLVAKKDTIIYEKAFGLANQEWQVANTTATRYPLASLTKQFTAAAILQLAEQEKLSVEDRLSKFFPGFPKGDSITLHMLMNHTSGIREYSRHPEIFKFFANKPTEGLKDTIIHLFQKLPFDFSPGTHWRYSNTGYILLGYIIEQVSGQSYNRYVHKELFQKAGMVNSGLFHQDSVIPQRAYGYTQTEKGLVTQMIIPYRIGYSEGGLYSTTGDLFRWGKALTGGNIIGQHYLDKMNHPNRGDHGAGYGIFVDKSFGRKVFFHTGNIPGYSTSMIYYPEDDIRIILLANRETNLDFLPKGLAAILFDKEVVNPYPHMAVAIKRDLSSFATTFEMPFPFQVLEKEGKLFMSFGREVALLPESETKLFVAAPDVDIQLEYVFNEKNEIAQVYFIEGGVKTEAKLKLTGQDH